MKKQRLIAAALAVLFAAPALALAGCAPPAAPSSSSAASASQSAASQSGQSAPGELDAAPLPNMDAAFTTEEEYNAVVLNTVNAILARYASGAYPTAPVFDGPFLNAWPATPPEGAVLPASVTAEDLDSTVTGYGAESGQTPSSHGAQVVILLEGGFRMHISFAVFEPGAYTGDPSAYVPSVTFDDMQGGARPLEAPLTVDGVIFTGSFENYCHMLSSDFSYNGLEARLTLMLADGLAICSFPPDGSQFPPFLVFSVGPEGALEQIHTNPPEIWVTGALPATLTEANAAETLAPVYHALLKAAETEDTA